MLWKCCTQNASKFGKLSSDRRTGKGQFSFEFQRKAILKNAQLHSSHMLAKQPGFNSTWTVNFQMLMLDSEKADEPEIKLPTSSGSLKKWENSRKHIYFCFTDLNFRCSSWFYKRQKNQRSNCQYPLNHWKSKRVPEKHLFLLYWQCQSLWLCKSQ